jgi:hypothetical protein
MGGIKTSCLGRVDYILTLGSHLSALSSTAATGFSTLLTMFMLMMTAFFYTIFASLSTKLTDFFDKRRLLLLHVGTELTDIRTVQTTLYTFPHHLQLLFF